jgi:hypothetical protein
MDVYALGSTQYWKFTSRDPTDDNQAATLASGAVDFYEENNSTPITGADTVSADYNSVTGFNDVAGALTTANGFEAGKTYYGMLAAGTVASAAVSLVGEIVVPKFRIETASELAAGLLRDALYPTATLGASGSHSTTVIDMTGAIDANTPAAGIVGEVLAVYDATDAHVELVRCTAFTATTLLATVARIDDAGALGFTPASGDYVFRLGPDPKWAVEQALTDIKLDHLIAVAESDDPADDSIIAKLAAGDGDWSTFTAGSFSLSTIGTNVATLLTRITSTLFTGITSLAEWLGLIAGKQTGDATARTELRATGAGSGTFDETADSQEATRDRGDAAWAGTGATAEEIADAVLDEALSGHVTAGTLGERVGRIPNAAAGGNGGLPTVDASNRVAGIAGTITTLDALDTAQDTQHAQTQTDIAALNDLSAAAVNAEADTAIADAFGIVAGSVNDASAAVTGFTVTDDAGSDIRLGTLRLTSGALAGESRLVTWTGTTVAVVQPTSVPAGLTTVGPFSAAPANGVTYTFRPL